MENPCAAYASSVPVDRSARGSALVSTNISWGILVPSIGYDHYADNGMETLQNFSGVVNRPLHVLTVVDECYGDFSTASGSTARYSAIQPVIGFRPFLVALTPEGKRACTG
jgi:hypothetical protein